MNHWLFFIALLAINTPVNSEIKIKYKPEIRINFQPSWKAVLAAGVIAGIAGLTTGAIASYSLSRKTEYERLFDEANNYAYELNARYGNLMPYGSGTTYAFEAAYKRFIIQTHAYDQFPFIAEALYIQQMLRNLHSAARMLNQARNDAQKRLNRLSYQLSIDTTYEHNYLISVIENCTFLHSCMLKWEQFCEKELLGLLVMMPEYATEYNLKYGNWRSYEIDVYTPQSVSVSFSY